MPSHGVNPVTDVRWPAGGRLVAELVPPLKVALVVGTVLCLINGTYRDGSLARVALNYLVPFVVATYSRLSLLRSLASPPAERP